MATSIYISDEVKTRLDEAARLDHRALIDEIDYLVSERLEILKTKQQSQKSA